MNQSPLNKHNNHYALTFKGTREIEAVTAPIFYELKNYNEAWQDTFQPADLFDHVLTESLKNEKFQSLVFTDEFASSLQREIEETEDRNEVEIVVQFNNFVNKLFYRNLESITTRGIKTALLRIDPDLDFNSIAGLSASYRLFNSAVFSVFPKKIHYYRNLDSTRFKREMKEIEIEITDLKEQFFVKEITQLFSLKNPPDHLLFVLKALAFILTDRVIDWDNKGFTMKDICDFLLRMKPWTLTVKQRVYLKREFLRNPLWDLNKIAKQSHHGSIMARWLEANVEAAELIDNVKTQSKSFEVTENLTYSYYRLPGGCNWAVAELKLSEYPPNSNSLTHVFNQIDENLRLLRKQGFKNKYLKPKWVLLLCDGGFSFNGLESHREGVGFFLSSIYTNYNEFLKHEVSVDPDTGFLRVEAPDGEIIRPQTLGPFRVYGMLYK